MKKRMKTIITILLIIVVGGCIYFTVKDAQEAVKPNNEFTGMSKEGFDERERPELPSDNGDGKMEDEPPEKPDDDKIPDGIQGRGQRPNDLKIDGQDSQETHIKKLHYIMFGMEALIIFILVMSLIVSKFNNREV